MKRTLRVVTWNCWAGSYERKVEAVRTLDPDVLLLQEVGKPPDGTPGALWWGSTSRKGIGLVVRDGWHASPMPISPPAPWSIVPVAIAAPGVTFHLLAVWARADSGYLRGLIDALDAYRGFLGSAPAMVVGDFNASAIWDSPRKGIDFTRLATRLEMEHKLKSAYHSYFQESYGKETRPTHFFRWNQNQPFHIDYCFLPTSWSVIKIDVGDYRTWSALSDHRPLCVEASVDVTRLAVDLTH